MEFFISILSLNFILNFPGSNGYGLLIHPPLDTVESFLLETTAIDILRFRPFVGLEFHYLCTSMKKRQHIDRFDKVLGQSNQIQLIYTAFNVDGIKYTLSSGNSYRELTIFCVPCPEEEDGARYYIMKFENYDKYFAFWKKPSNNEMDLVVITDYLPLKNTGIAAIKYIENLQSVAFFQRQIDILRICASLFMNLQFYAVKSLKQYYIKYARIGNEVKCVCYEYKYEIDNLITVLAYTFSIGSDVETKKTLILKRHSINEKFSTFILYPKNMLL